MHSIAFSVLVLKRTGDDDRGVGITDMNLFIMVLVKPGKRRRRLVHLRAITGPVRVILHK